jgi:hypothetical protein
MCERREIAITQHIEDMILKIGESGNSILGL